jgi:GNAT superfamily N-acetyltransferase
MAEKKNAMEVAYRASMLPIGNYEDGSIAFPVWPQMAIQAQEAFGRFGRGENPQPGDEILAFMTPGIGGAFGKVAGAAEKGLARSVAGAERAEASSGLPSHSVEAGSFDFTPGAPRSADIGRSSLSYLPEDGMVELTALGTPEAYRGQGAATQAMQRFTGALDEAGLPSRLVARGDTGTDPARLQSFYASHGYGAPGPDGYMVRPAEHHAHTQPRNPAGQFVTSDSFDGRLHAFQKVLVDLDGDGIPDAVADAPPPTNAMLGFQKAGR